MRPFVKQDLDELKCNNSGCKENHPIMLTPACHPRSGSALTWDSTDHVLIVTCHSCGKTVCEIEVASATIQ